LRVAVADNDHLNDQVNAHDWLEMYSDK